MSTKTSIKRIAAIAAVALTLGGFTAVTANATTGTNLITPTVGVVKGAASATATVSGVVGGQVAFTYNASTTAARYITADSGSTIVSATATTGTAVATNGTSVASGVTATLDGTTADEVTVTLTSAVAGTSVVTIKTINSSTGVSSSIATLTITWGSAPTLSAQYSLLTLNAGNGTTATGSAADTTATTVAKTAGTKQFTIQAVVKDSNNAATTTSTLAASITGPGSIGIADGTGGGSLAGRALSVALTAGTGSVSVYGDGTAGKATITITVTTSAGVTTTLGSKSVTFVGSPSKAVATQNLYVAKAATTLGATPSTTYTTNDGTTLALTPAFSVEVMDSNGNDVAAGATVKMTSSDTSAITVGTCAEYSAYPGNFECSVSGAVGAASGASATVTFSVYNSTTLAYDIVANALTFKVGGAIASVTPTLDAVSYDAGQKMVLKYSAVDSAGNAAYDGQAPVSAVASNKTVGGALPAVTKYIKNGYYATSATSPSLFAPSVGGSFTISGTTIATVAAPLGAAWSLDASVTTIGDTAANAATDAANEATDAANAATDAALAAADAADAATAAAQDASDAVAALSATVAKLVASLKAQITSLTNLVIKIQKKVRA